MGEIFVNPIGVGLSNARTILTAPQFYKLLFARPKQCVGVLRVPSSRFGGVGVRWGLGLGIFQQPLHLGEVEPKGPSHPANAPRLQAIKEVRGTSSPTQVEPIERANRPQGALTAPNSNHRQIFDCQVRIVLQHTNQDRSAFA